MARQKKPPKVLCVCPLSVSELNDLILGMDWGLTKQDMPDCNICLEGKREDCPGPVKYERKDSE